MYAVGSGDPYEMVPLLKVTELFFNVCCGYEEGVKLRFREITDRCVTHRTRQLPDAVACRRVPDLCTPFVA